jgi:PAS domain S-box-containing protein
MDDETKHKEQLIRELQELREQNALLQETIARSEDVEKTRQDSDNRFRALVENSPVGIWHIDLQGKTIYINPAMCSLLEIEGPEELRDKTYHAFFTPESQAAIERERVKRPEGIVSTYEVELIGKKGRRSKCLIHGAPVYSAQGKVESQIGTFVDLSEKEKGLAALKKSEEEFRIIFDNSFDGILLADAESKTFYRGNKSICRMLGYSEDEIIDLAVKDIHLPNDLSWIVAEFEKLARGEIKVAKEIPVKKKDGQIFFADIGATPIVLGDRTYLMGIFRDVSERKGAEEALKRQRDLANQYLDIARVMLVVIGPDQKVRMINKKGMEVLGYSEAEIIGQNWFDLVIPRGIRDEVKGVFDKLMAGEIESVDYYENVVLTKEGQERFIAWHNTLITSEQGTIIGTLSSGEDITERKITENKLRESEERYRTVADFTYDWEQWVGPERNFLYVSPSCERITGYKPHEFISDPALFFRIIHPDDQEMVKRHFRDEHYHPNPEHREFRIITKGGEERWISHTCQPVYGADDHWLGRRAGNRDITENKRMEAQLRQAQRMEAIGTLAGGIAHDFNNILTPILMGTELAQLTLAEEDPVQEDLQRVLQATHRAKELVRQILTFSRQEKEEVRPLKLTSIVKEVVKLVRASLPATIEIRQKLLTQADTVLADPIHIHQVLLNLCTNAAHAMREKGGTLEIGLDSEKIEESALNRIGELNPGKFVVLTIQDTGHGMDQRTMEKIFDPFFTTKERGEGTGMGLSVVHGIIKNLKGAITVESKPQKGTLFTVWLPCVEEDLIIERRKTEGAPRGSERLLFVDDEAVIPEMYKSMLMRLGYRVEIRTDPVDAWYYFRHHPDQVDLIITDQTMPDLTGLELAEKVFRIRPGMPVILCSGFSQEGVEEAAKKRGISTILYKPIDRLTMARTIRRVLDSKKVT